LSGSDTDIVDHDAVYAFWRNWWLRHEFKTTQQRTDSFKKCMSIEALGEFHRKSKHVLDLHNMPLPVAIVAVNTLLEERNARPWEFNDVNIIVGKATHSSKQSRSTGGILAPKIQRLLEPYQFVIPEENPGLLVIPAGQMPMSGYGIRTGWKIYWILQGALEKWAGWLRGHGLGASIQGIHGERWGRAVEDDMSAWVLDTTRIAKKQQMGTTWTWVRGPPPVIHARWSGWLCGRGVGASIEGIDGERWGIAVEEDNNVWWLDSGRRAKKAGMGTKWKWVRGVLPYVHVRRTRFWF